MGNLFRSATERFYPQPVLNGKASSGPISSQTVLNQARSSQASTSHSQPAPLVVDTFASVQAFSREMPSAVKNQPNLMVQDARGQVSDARHYLNDEELQQMQSIPEHLQRRILNVSSTQPVAQAREQIKTNAQRVIQELTQSNRLNFKGKQGKQWELASMLSLTSAVHRLPIAQRKQLDGVSFVRAAHAEMPANHMLYQVAAQSIAGHYDVANKAVILYDAGLRDDLPELNTSLKNSLRQVGQPGQKTVNRQVQEMLNPYLVSLNKTPLTPDGVWGPKTAQAVRTVQIELLSRQAQKHQLTPQQTRELEQLSLLASSPQFDMISRMTDIRSRMENLNLLPDPAMKQLLEEFTRSDFGEASLRFVMQDISNDFRSKGSDRSSRAEEILVHEMGHYFQLGLKNEQYYVSEFSKISNWRETADNSRADGYIQGGYSGEDLADVYNILASGGKMDAGHYRAEVDPAARSNQFVSTYAATDPMEDFAESYKAFVMDPGGLMKTSPAKFFFMNALPSIQARKMGSGNRESAHYQPSEVERFARAALEERHQISPTQEHVKAFIRDEFKNLMGVNEADRPLYLQPETVLAVVETHRSLLERVDMPYIPTEKIYQQGDPDYQVFRQLNEHTRNLIVSDGKAPASKRFFQQFRNPREIDRLFPDASPALREKLKDPAFSSMMLALGEIGGHAYYLNQLRNEDLKDQRDYQQARGFFNTVMAQPSAVLSKQTIGHTWNYLRGLGNEVFNPEERKVSKTLQFFDRLSQNPAQAFPEIWDQLPKDFQALLRDARFIQAASGDQGRYLPNPQATRETLEKVLEVLEFERSLDALMNGN